MARVRNFALPQRFKRHGCLVRQRLQCPFNLLQLPAAFVPVSRANLAGQRWMFAMTDQGQTCFVEDIGSLFAGVYKHDLAGPPLAIVRPVELEPLLLQCLIDVCHLQDQLLLWRIFPSICLHPINQSQYVSVKKQDCCQGQSLWVASPRP